MTSSAARISLMYATYDPEALYRFFVLVGADVHASWVPFLPAGLVAPCQSSPLGVRLLSRLLLHRFHDLRVPDLLVLTPEHRWLLAPRAALAARARAIGARALAPRLRMDAARERGPSLREAFGEALYQEALGAEPIGLRGVPWRAIEAWAEPREIAAFAERVGVGLMLQALSDSERGLRRRLGLRFPREYTTRGSWRAAAANLAPVRAQLTPCLQ